MSDTGRIDALLSAVADRALALFANLTELEDLGLRLGNADRRGLELLAADADRERARRR